jgi:hypothetical protein
MSARTARLAVISAGVLGILLTSAPPALADHHLMSIREWYPGTAATAQDAFLELQMYAPGQNQTNGQDVHVYGPGADATPDEFTTSAMPVSIPVLNPENQRTVLLGANTNGPANRDYTENLDDAPGLDPLGGAICFVSNSGFGTIDCVEWGTGNNTINAGTPVLPGGIPDGQSITRTIAPNCPTLLELGDDTNNSAADFSQTAPTPRGNTDPITETACVPPTVFIPPGNPTSPINPAGHVRKRKCKKKQKTAAAAKRRKCKKKKR